MADQNPPPAKALRHVPRPPPVDDDDGLEMDDDPLDDLFGEDHKRLSTLTRIFYVILAIFVAGMIAYLILIIVYPEQFGAPSWIGADTAQKDGKAKNGRRPGFLLGGVRMGMAPDEVMTVYPNLKLEPGTEGGLVGFFPHHDGLYNVWFRALEYGSVAFRIRSEHSYPTASYLKLMAELSERYGPPTQSDCGAEDATPSIQCTLGWTFPGTAVEALIRTAVPPAGGEARTMLAVTATDTRPPVKTAP